MAVALTLIVCAPAIATAAPPQVRPFLVNGAPAGTPLYVRPSTTPPEGYRMSSIAAYRLANANPKVRAALARNPRLLAYVYVKGAGVWQVSWYTRPPPAGRQVIQVFVDDVTGRVVQVWTGWQLGWLITRGYPNGSADALYEWLPLCALFLLPFLPIRLGRARVPPISPTAARKAPPPPPRKRGRGGTGTLTRPTANRAPAGAPRVLLPIFERPTLLHLDLVMLLGVSVSLAFFDTGDLGVSVPLVYVFLLYLLVRMLLLASGRGCPSRPLRIAIPTRWLVAGLVLLIAGRVVLDIVHSVAGDVGLAGVVGADKVLHGANLYGGWPAYSPHGDSYGPLSYFAYVPFNLIFGWNGQWAGSVPAAHAAAITFDLLTIGALFLLGRSLRGPDLGILLAYCWAAFPFTTYALSFNTNDALMALTIVVALLAVGSRPARGVAAAAAGLTKFAPLALAPLLLRGTDRLASWRSWWRFLLPFIAVVCVLMAPVVLSGDLGSFWRNTISYQATRVTPLSSWGLWGGRGVLQHLVQAGAVVVGVAALFYPRRRGIVELTALGAAILIALQLGLNWWFYVYMIWFFPLVMVALLTAQPKLTSNVKSL